MSRVILTRIYETYVMEFCGLKFSQDRYLECAHNHRDERLEGLRHSLPDTPWMPVLQERTNALGYTLTAHITGAKRLWARKRSMNTVEICGAVCRIYPVTTKHRPHHTTDREYSRVVISKKALQGVDVCIFPVMFPTPYSDWPIIAAAVLEQKLLADGRESATLNFPHERVLRPHKMRLDPWQFVGKWKTIRLFQKA